MSSIRPLLFVLLALPLALPLASAAPDYCDKYGVCGGPFVSTDDGVCAGYAHAYGGSAACVHAVPEPDACIISAGEFWYERTCASDYLA